MTQKEKAKAYDELLAKAKQIYNKENDVLIIHTIEDLFPELAESEDERIRKALIDFFGKSAKYGGHTNGVDDKDILAWLKNQGKRKTPQWMIDFLDSYRRKIGCSLDHDEVRDVEGKILCIIQWLEEQNGQEKDILEDAILDGNEDGLIAETIRYKNEKQSEQKPAWSEEDERLCQCLIEDQKEALDIVHNDKYGHSEIISDLKEMYHERIDWLKSLKDRVLPQQSKQEWSEEEIEKAAQEWDSKANFNPFYMTMEGDKPTGVKQHITTHKESFKAGVNWILKYGVQPKQEWSEEDKDYYDAIIAKLEVTQEDAALTNNQMNFLKSLRPLKRWKPSEDDIIILEKLIKGELEPKVFQATLHGILEQLKKLKEE